MSRRFLSVSAMLSSCLCRARTCSMCCPLKRLLAEASHASLELQRHRSRQRKKNFHRAFTTTTGVCGPPPSVVRHAHYYCMTRWACITIYVLIGSSARLFPDSLPSLSPSKHTYIDSTLAHHDAPANEERADETKTAVQHLPSKQNKKKQRCFIFMLLLLSIVRFPTTNPCSVRRIDQ